MINPIGYTNALALLQKASLPEGFTAAVEEHDNYKRVWTRDGTICSIAAFLTNNTLLHTTAKATIETVFNHQHPSGFIPSNVNPITQSVSYGGVVGRADNPCWAVIGLCYYTLYTKEYDLADKYKNNIAQCLQLLDAWEFNGKHLIYVPQSGDWADEYIQHGYILFEQLLRIWALRLASKVYNNNAWLQKAATIQTVVENNYWITQDSTPYFTNLFVKQKEAFNNYWLMGFNPARVYSYFDLQANALALLLNIGTAEQQNILIDKIRELFFNDVSTTLIPSFYPAIQETDDDMKELRNNFSYQFRNHPHQFHNGGLWPVWNGLFSMALSKAGKKDLAIQLTHTIHDANATHNFSFNECLHAQTLAPCGVNYCSWSAAGAVFAEEGLQQNFIIT